MRTLSPDVAVIGAGPVGCVTALAFARSGAKVMVLEAAPQNTKRLAGEWLHPPGLKILERLGILLAPDPVNYPTGMGFVVFADDGTEPIQLHYPSGVNGLSCEHHLIVSTLRKAAINCKDIIFIPDARVTQIQGQQLTFQHLKKGETFTLSIELIVGADGRSSMARKSLRIPHNSKVVSYMAALLLEDIELPFEGFGHVFLGGLGPVFVYRIGNDRVRMCLDVPLNFQKRSANLWDAYSPILPSKLLGAFRKALENDRVVWVTNQYSSRTHYGRPGLALVGDATGYFHPMTATGMTIGFMDTECLLRSRNFEEYQRQRTFGTYVPEMLASTLYEVFCRNDDSAAAIRKAIYQIWRQDSKECVRTMHLLSGAQTNIFDFSESFLKGLAIAVCTAIEDNAAQGKWPHLMQVLGDFGQWLRLPVAIAIHRFRHHQRGSMDRKDINHKLSLQQKQISLATDQEIDFNTALENSVKFLISQQQTDGSWEGEVVWCPMLPAQFVLMSHITKTPISPERRQAILQQFKATRLASGLWGLHEKSQPFLFVTTLVYVAARILGVQKEDPLLAPALKFIQEQGGVVSIPTWGKFWLAMLNLYDWSGVNPVLPEAWLLPEWIPAHPGNYYCHTRLIYMPMGFIYGRKFQIPVTPLIETLRSELYVVDYQQVNFNAAKSMLRQEEVYNPPSIILQLIYKLSNFYERWHRQDWRSKAIAQMVDCIHFELQTTDYTSLSPVSGLLNIIALWLHDSNDADLQKALERFEGWIWEDEQAGLRIAGARSSTWDTGFAIQALQAASSQIDVSDSLLRAQKFLSNEQIRTTFPNINHLYRIDPKGGFCFAGVWHGWPVSDCTAEALLALLDAPPEVIANCNLPDAVEFILRCQNADGGFGSYERRKIGSTLEWMNPAEMFGNSMTEHSYIECTASCLMALREFCNYYPEMTSDRIDTAIRRGGSWLRQQQKPDGSWLGFWGVNCIYGTMFGIHGLLAATNNTNDPAINKACDWIVSTQRLDGGWGEHFQGCLSGKYVEHTESQVTQTAWAIMALLKVGTNYWEEVTKGACFLANRQLENGGWPKQDMSGLFFHTALLDYTLYRSYFPLWALSLYELRRQERHNGMVKKRDFVGTNNRLDQI